MIFIDFVLESNVLQDIDNRVNQLNEKLISNSSKFDQLMQKLYVKIDRLTSNINVVSHLKQKIFCYYFVELKINYEMLIVFSLFNTFEIKKGVPLKN